VCPSSPTRDNMQDVLQGSNQLKESLKDIRISNKHGLKANLMENIYTLLKRGVKIDENTLKKINIFRLQQFEI
jgi:hypothetical protein